MVTLVNRGRVLLLRNVGVKTGERRWNGGRYGYGQVILASGHLVMITEEGELVLVKAKVRRLLRCLRQQTKKCIR